jgi:uncharacterized protein with HEPN domain
MIDHKTGEMPSPLRDSTPIPETGKSTNRRAVRKRQDNLKSYLIEILDNIAYAREFIEGADYIEFVSDRRTVYALAKSLEIITGRSKLIPKEMKLRYREVPWKAIAATGKMVTRDFQGLGELLMWETTQNDLLFLKRAVELMLRELPASHP